LFVAAIYGEANTVRTLAELGANVDAVVDVIKGSFIPTIPASHLTSVFLLWCIRRAATLL